jgi:hypothetical protein
MNLQQATGLEIVAKAVKEHRRESLDTSPKDQATIEAATEYTRVTGEEPEGVEMLAIERECNLARAQYGLSHRELALMLHVISKTRWATMAEMYGDSGESPTLRLVA